MFDALFQRDNAPIPWTKIPWDDPEFSRRMLREHLDQSHDMASRRAIIIDRHVAWIHGFLLEERPSRILDLGCGPGFYARRLRALGHSVTGLDISPASIAYALEHDPTGDYVLGDIRTLDYGGDFDLVMLIFGELNAFSPDEAKAIIEKAHHALSPGGRLLLEVHPWSVVEQVGRAPASWFTTDTGLFADGPYLCLTESRFERDRAVSRFFVFTSDGAPMQTYTTMLQAYTESDYRLMLSQFESVSVYPALTGDGQTVDLEVWVAQKG